MGGVTFSEVGDQGLNDLTPVGHVHMVGKVMVKWPELGGLGTPPPR